MNFKRERDEIFVEVSSKPYYPYPERIPSASDPIGEIYVRARAFRTLGSGNVRWWVLVAGWLIFGSIFLLVATIAILGQSFIGIFPITIVSIPLFPLWRGTAKKLSRRHHQ